jgi:hypothetical protein
MNAVKFSAGLLLLIVTVQALAYDSKEAMIDDKLRILAEAGDATKIEMLQRLQWSGLSDERLFDRIAEWPQQAYSTNDLNSDEVNLMSHQIRALGFSGNPKYQTLLESAKASAGNKKIKRHAGNALRDLANYERWNAEIAQSDFSVSGKPFEVANYMKMINSADTAVQRMGARAVFHERQSDPELLEMIARELQANYQREGLDGETQDTLAWFCKALGQNALGQYGKLLVEVRDNTPYSKIRKWARKYVK